MLYRQMWSEFMRGALPVPDLRNLDVYHEIGARARSREHRGADRRAYRALYREKLAEWHSAYPIGPDARFWRRAVEGQAQDTDNVQSLDDRRAVA